MEQYPRVQKLQRMLGVINRTITEAEREGATGVRALTVFEGPEVGCRSRQGHMEGRHTADVKPEPVPCARELRISSELSTRQGCLHRCGFARACRGRGHAAEDRGGVE